jgi:hypothetical protein
MRKTLLWSIGFVAIMIGVAIAQDSMTDHHVLTTAKDLKWGDAPPVFEKGATMALVSGDPSKDGPLLRAPQDAAGYRSIRTGTRPTSTSP